ncbi:MAG: outer membrane beta-barrel protein [Syntrophomonadaceae bacterium]
MKTITASLILLVIGLTSLSLAQDYNITKDLYRISGSVGMSYNSQKYESQNSTMTDFFFAPGVSYLVTDNVELGISIGYDYSEQKTKFSDWPSEYKNIYSSISIGSGVRYYFTNRGIIPFAGASFSYNAYGLHGSSQNELSSLSLACGISYFLSSSIALEPSFTYRYSFGTNDVTSNQIIIGAGINYFIRK